MDHACQVDFYVLARPTQSAGELACRLAMRAWEQGHRVLVRVANDGRRPLPRLVLAVDGRAVSAPSAQPAINPSTAQMG